VAGTLMATRKTGFFECTILGSDGSRTFSNQLKELEDQFLSLIEIDFSNSLSIDIGIDEIKNLNFAWDFVILCPGTMEPIGRFDSCNIDDWEKTIKINFLSQLRFMHGILPFKYTQSDFFPKVIFFAGGGTNSAPVNFSAYTLSKIALIKAVELLDAEHDDICFTILGPGWVKTKIHSETIRAGESSGKAGMETVRRLEANEFISMSQVIDCCWLLHSPKSVVGGRNFSVVNDAWGQGIRLHTNPGSRSDSGFAGVERRITLERREAMWLA